MKAVVMCGGTGSRMRPITELIPKPLLPLGDKTILDIILETLKKNHVQTVYLTLGYRGKDIEKHIRNRDYGMDIYPVYEDKPLGTAGGVKNAVGEINEDVLVVSGDNLFSYNLQAVLQEHRNKNAVATIIGSRCKDPRDYGTCVLAKDGRIIRFVEKPNWAHAESDIINTGLYFLNPAVLKMIPDGVFADFANDIFPKLLTMQNALFCSMPDGQWWDLGDIAGYLDAFSDILQNHSFSLTDGAVIRQDRLLPNGARILAPAIVQKNVLIGTDSVIGPCCYLGENCVVEERSSLANTIMLQGSHVACETDMQSVFVGQNCQIGSFCKLAKYSALSGNITIADAVRLSENTKIWPGCEIASEQTLQGDVFECSTSNVSLTASGISGEPFHGLSLWQAAELSCAVACADAVQRVGVSTDGTAVSDIYKNVMQSGLLSCSCTVYDFGKIFRIQRNFLSFYCSLDFFIHISSDEDRVHISFSGKNGQPVSSSVFRQITSAFRYRSFRFSEKLLALKYFEMHPMLTVYKAYLSHMLENAKTDLKVAVDCDNKAVYELLTHVLKKKDYEIGYGGILFILDKDAEKFYAIENERAFSYDRILTICCKIEFEAGSDVSVGEEASGQLDELATSYGRTLYRAYEDDKELSLEAALLYTRNMWVSDALFCIIRLLNIMQDSGKTLAALSDELPDYYVRHLNLVYAGEPADLQKSLKEIGAVRSSKRLGYFEIEDERGSVRLKPDATGRNLRVLVESGNIELSRELTAEIETKFGNCSIDNSR